MYDISQLFPEGEESIVEYSPRQILGNYKWLFER